MKALARLPTLLTCVLLLGACARRPLPTASPTATATVAATGTETAELPPSSGAGGGRTVTGQIIQSSGDRQPVAGLKLQLEPGGEFVAETDVNGEFTLSNVPTDETSIYASHLQFVIPAGEEAHLDLGIIDYPLIHPPVLPLADYPSRDTPYLIEYGDFWLVHYPEGSLLAFVPVSPEYREDVAVEACRFTWDEAVGRFVDPCSGDEWELDGTLNLAHSTERWSNRDLDRYAITLQEGAFAVHLDQVITGTAGGSDVGLNIPAGVVPIQPTSTRPTVPYTYPGITLTLQAVSYTRYETNVSLQIEIAGDHADNVSGAGLAQPTLVDDQGNRYEPGLSSATIQTTADGLLVEVTQSFRPAAIDTQTLFLETGLELRAEASSTVTIDLRGRQPGDRWPVDQTVEIYGLMVPIEEATLIAEPGAVSLQMAAPCVSEGGVRLIYLELLAGGETHQGDGHSVGCGDGQERLVSTRTIEGLVGGSAPGEMESVTLRLAGRFHLPGPWELSWEVGE